MAVRGTIYSPRICGGIVSLAIAILVIHPQLSFIAVGSNLPPGGCDTCRQLRGLEDAGVNARSLHRHAALVGNFKGLFLSQRGKFKNHARGSGPVNLEVFQEVGNHVAVVDGEAGDTLEKCCDACKRTAGCLQYHFFLSNRLRDNVNVRGFMSGVQCYLLAKDGGAGHSGEYRTPLSGDVKEQRAMSPYFPLSWLGGLCDGSRATATPGESAAAGNDSTGALPLATSSARRFGKPARTASAVLRRKAERPPPLSPQGLLNASFCLVSDRRLHINIKLRETPPQAAGADLAEVSSDVAYAAAPTSNPTFAQMSTAAAADAAAAARKEAEKRATAAVVRAALASTSDEVSGVVEGREGEREGAQAAIREIGFVWVADGLHSLRMAVTPKVTAENSRNIADTANSLLSLLELDGVPLSPPEAVGERVTGSGGLVLSKVAEESEWPVNMVKYRVEIEGLMVVEVRASIVRGEGDAGEGHLSVMLMKVKVSPTVNGLLDMALAARLSSSSIVAVSTTLTSSAGSAGSSRSANLLASSRADWSHGLSLRSLPSVAANMSRSRSSVSTIKCMAEASQTTAAAVSSPATGLRVFRLADLAEDDVAQLLTRPRIDFTSIFSTVGPIVEDVRQRGDEAVKEYTERFDRVKLDDVVVRVAELPDPELPADVAAAFDVAFSNIHKFHLAQMPSSSFQVETMPGVVCGRVARPIERVGLYVPGGTAVLPSTALMLAVPAGIAGCTTVVVATPPRPDGSICPEVLYCCKKAGATHILKAGGAQAVAAMAWGTATCPKVDKIFGPGNQYVTAAKMALQTSEAMVSIDMPAGPSEVLVIADETASPSHVAADLLSQAEHGPDSQVVLVAVGEGVNLAAIEAEVERQRGELPRGDVAAKALSHSYVVVAADINEACLFSNRYAPEHLIINAAQAVDCLPLIRNAGSVFLGPWTPESVGDYASGTNHVLPTYGYARMYGGVSLDAFFKHITVQSLSASGLQLLGPSVAKMAEVEGLEAHRLAFSSAHVREEASFLPLLLLCSSAVAHGKALSSAATAAATAGPTAGLFFCSPTHHFTAPAAARGREVGARKVAAAVPSLHSTNSRTWEGGRSEEGSSCHPITYTAPAAARGREVGARKVAAAVPSLHSTTTSMWEGAPCLSNAASLFLFSISFASPSTPLLVLLPFCCNCCRNQQCHCGPPRLLSTSPPLFLASSPPSPPMHLLQNGKEVKIL
ncbi:unnamed protein product [Closterium sp. NIES-65]|nr:unnamed protein product [Closterium sp. NIES-65]